MGGKQRNMKRKEITIYFVFFSTLRTKAQKASVKKGAMVINENLVPISNEDIPEHSLRTAQ